MPGGSGDVDVWMISRPTLTSPWSAPVNLGTNVNSPYHDGGPVGTAAALHLAASLPNFFIQQIPFPHADEDRRFRAELAGGEVVTDGYLSLPAAPGLGLKINSSLLQEVA